VLWNLRATNGTFGSDARSSWMTGKPQVTRSALKVAFAVTWRGIARELAQNPVFRELRRQETNRVPCQRSILYG
jgi:hypothetical protein